MAKSIKKLNSILPLPLSDDQLQDVVEKAKDWALMHGLGMRNKSNFSFDSLDVAPFILLPTAFSRREFEKAVSLQTTFNLLIHRIAYDRLFLTESLRETIQVDDFTGNLFKIYETVQDEGVNQKISLGLLRSDYLVHTSANDKIKQVEINAIASSFGGITSQFKNFHGYILQELKKFDMLRNLPDNNALKGLCEGMLEAWKIYGNENAAILFLVEDVTYNICDQRFHEFQLKQLEPRVTVIRRTLTDIGERAYMNTNNELIIDDLLVSVIYLRAGYVPDHYHSKKEWDARLLMERSQAIKCPTIQYQLAGTKKIQQTLAKSGVLEKYLTNQKEIDSIREVFMGQYSLDFDEFGDQAVQMALEDPERFVLKPQLEGGGNNIYGLEIRDTILQVKDSRERAAWILMERINPPTISGYMVRPGGPSLPHILDLVSELGIYGVIIGDSHKIYTNRQVGHMLRTKTSDANEGGVAAGLGALDSPYLID